VELVSACPSVRFVDLTGGAPELNPEFRYLVTEARRMGKEVIDRCNLTVLFEPGQEDLAEFLAANQVHVVASLPCYSADNVNKQRGGGVFDLSIKALQLLNSLGYGKEGSGLVLDLVYNPVGPFLPPAQGKLEEAYKSELMSCYGISFNSLFTITNMPVKRFASFLHRQGQLEDYMQLLISAFNPAAVANVMCRNLISIDWQGALFDCDFNQQLNLNLPPKPSTAPNISLTSPPPPPRTVFDIQSLEDLVDRPIATAAHCYGCTAGNGSSLPTTPLPEPMAAEKTPPALLRNLLAPLILSCLLLPLAPVRAFDLDCANEANQAVSVLSFCNGDGWRRTCLYGGGYSPDGSTKCALVQAGALYCQDCEWTIHMLSRCCDIDLSGYEYSSGQQADTYYIEEGIKQLQCPGNFDCGESGYPQCNGGGFDGTTPYWSNEYAYAESYGYCAEFDSSSGPTLRAMEPRAHSSGGVKLRELERPQLIESSRNGALAGGKTKMRRRMWGNGRPWSPHKMYSRRLWGSGRPMYRRLYGSGRPWSPPRCTAAAFMEAEGSGTRNKQI
ncbi:unnamed protein product, partial [Closterium sp. Yama58-4]